MTLLVLVILAVIWAAVLLPPYLQSRSESRPADSISSFQRQLSVLERRAGTVPSVPGRSAARPGAVRPGMARTSMVLPAVRMSRAEARRRRRDVLCTLAGAAAITFVLSLAMGGAVWALQLGCDLLLGGYVFLLIQVQQRAMERESKVRYLPERQARRTPEPALLMRRSGS